MWARPLLAGITGPLTKLSADIVTPCDKQLPWKKLHSSWLALAGLTINGELYFVPRFSDLLSGYFVRRIGPRNSRNDFYAASTTSDFARLFFPDAPFAFKDFSLAHGFANTFSGPGRIWSSMTLVTSNSRVFVAGSSSLGEHGISPDTQKPNATVESNFAQYNPYQTFWQSTIPPYFPVATEVSLPQGVGAAAVPQGSVGSVIGDDRQLYAWWRDPSDGTMYPPKKITGFVTSITMTSTGSSVKELNYQASGIPNQNEVRRWSWLDFTEPPAGGTKPVAYAEFGYTNPYRLTGRVVIVTPGMGYTTPPAAWLNGIVWNGAPPQFSCTIFGSSDSFALPLKADMPWIIGSDGCVYDYVQPFCIMRPYRVAGSDHNGVYTSNYEAFKPLAPVRVTAPGVRFQYAGGTCFVAEDGSYYVPFPRDSVRSSLPFDTESAVLDYYRLTDPPTTAYNDYGVSLKANFNFTNYAPPPPDALKTDYALFKIGSGFVNGASNVPLSSVSEGYSKYTAVGIKSDGTLWTAGSNFRGLLGDSEDLDASRRTFQEIADGTKWTSVYSSISGLDGGEISYSMFYAIQKDAVCRSRTQPMEYVRDDYYSNPAAIR